MTNDGTKPPSGSFATGGIVPRNLKPVVWCGPAESIITADAARKLALLGNPKVERDDER